MVSLKFALRGKEYVVSAKPAVDPNEVIYDLEKEILTLASKQGLEIPELTRKYLISRICKTLIIQYPIKGDSEPLALEPIEIGE